MKTIKDYFEQGVRKAGSASALAKELGIVQQAASNYHLGQRVPDAKIARKLAIYIEEKEAVVVMAAESARSNDKEMKKFWQRLGEQLAMTAGIIIISGMALIQSGESKADTIKKSFYLAERDLIELIKNGRLNQALVSPRSAIEFNLPTTGANLAESPEALQVSAGSLQESDILRQLDTGIYINNLWYLNYSDHSAARLTGMTRFATFWVDKGKIIAPVNVMRFDESIYRLLGTNLEDLTEKQEYLIDPGSYGSRSNQTWHLPGALVSNLSLTL